MPRDPNNDDADFEGTLRECFEELDKQGYDHPTFNHVLEEVARALHSESATGLSKRFRVKPGPWICPPGNDLYAAMPSEVPVFLVYMTAGKFAIEGE